MNSIYNETASLSSLFIKPFSPSLSLALWGFTSLVPFKCERALIKPPRALPFLSSLGGKGGVAKMANLNANGETDCANFTSFSNATGYYSELNPLIRYMDDIMGCERGGVSTIIRKASVYRAIIINKLCKWR